MENKAALDKIIETTGKWGKYQIINYCILCLVVFFSLFPRCFIFTSRDTNHRCFIPECDNKTDSKLEFNPKWLINFVPYENDLPARCSRYSEVNNSMCHKTEFERKNRSNTDLEKCLKVIHEEPERTIANEFDIFCDENLWKLTMVGTISGIGELTSEIYTGYISDRYGRKRVIILTVLLSTILGLLKSYSVNYLMYVVLEYLDTALSFGKFVASFVLALEIVGQRQRNLGNSIACAAFAVGELIIGFMAWKVSSWRIMLRILYSTGVPLLFLIVLALSESARWLISVNKKEQALDVLNKIRKTNKIKLSEHELTKLIFAVEDQKIVEDTTDKIEESIKEVFLNRVLFCRILLCLLCWFCCSFTYNGLTLHSVALSENTYLSFIFSAFIEIPCCMINYYANEKCDRRKIMFFTLMLGGISCIAVEFIPEGHSWAILVSSLIGKGCITITFAVLFLFSSEMFPTFARHRILSICSFIGRFGMITAPQIPLLARISKRLPMLTFGTLSLLSALLSLQFPETANSKLPDTIQEALDIGKNRNK